jgi:uncharacterized cupin superfamily protein
MSDSMSDGVSDSVIDHVAALAVVLERKPVPSAQLFAGTPETGGSELGKFGGTSYGVWEMTPGAMSDIEVDELFIVIAGKATVLFLDTDETVSLTAGSTMRLRAGDRTIWTVTETLRKIYFTEGA